MILGKIETIRQEFTKAEGEKAEVFDVMYKYFTELLDALASQQTLINHLKVALEVIADWEFDIMGDCVADAKRVAQIALTADGIN